MHQRLWLTHMVIYVSLQQTFQRNGTKWRHLCFQWTVQYERSEYGLAEDEAQSSVNLHWYLTVVIQLYCCILEKQPHPTEYIMAKTWCPGCHLPMGSTHLASWPPNAHTPWPHTPMQAPSPISAPAKQRRLRGGPSLVGSNWVFIQPQVCQWVQHGGR